MWYDMQNVPLKYPENKIEDGYKNSRKLVVAVAG